MKTLKRRFLNGYRWPNHMGVIFGVPIKRISVVADPGGKEKVTEYHEVCGFTRMSGRSDLLDALRMTPEAWKKYALESVFYPPLSMFNIPDPEDKADEQWKALAELGNTGCGLLDTDNKPE